MYIYVIFGNIYRYKLKQSDIFLNNLEHFILLLYILDIYSVCIYGNNLVYIRISILYILSVYVYICNIRKYIIRYFLVLSDTNRNKSDHLDYYVYIRYIYENLNI